MATILVEAASTGSTVSGGGSFTSLTGISVATIYPTGAPSPWNNGIPPAPPRFECIAGADGLYEFDAPGASGAIVAGSRTVRLAAGDYVHLQVAQTSGANATVSVLDYLVRWIWA